MFHALQNKKSWFFIKSTQAKISLKDQAKLSLKRTKNATLVIFAFTKKIDIAIGELLVCLIGLPLLFEMFLIRV